MPNTGISRASGVTVAARWRGTIAVADALSAVYCPACWIRGPTPGPANKTLEALRILRVRRTRRRRWHAGASPLAVERHLKALNQSSAPSIRIKATDEQIPWRDLTGFRNVIVHGYLGVDLAVEWLVVKQDLPALTEAAHCMVTHLSPRS